MVVANNAVVQLPRVHQYPGAPPQFQPQPRAQRSAKTRLIRRVTAGVLVVLLALTVVYRYGQLSALNMGLNEQSKTRDALLDEQRHLKITISELRALGRLERVAIEELGMHYPGPSQIRYIGGNNPESRDGDGG